MNYSAPTIRYVWDLPLRLFHWGLVGAVGIAAATGFLFPEWWLDVHVLAGYGVGFLILFRLVWGFFGSHYSRFRSFLFPPHAVHSHLRGVLGGRPPHFTGHNPSGAIMVFALITVLALLVGTGVAALGGEEDLGPLAGLLTFRQGHSAKEIHEALAILVIGLVVVHVAGVIVESFLSRENLIKAMVTGHKNAAAGDPAPSPHPARPAAALAVLLGIVLTAGAGAAGLASSPEKPVSMPRLAALETGCGDCHGVFHPSLLPAVSWRMMMDDLSDHFGEDATLPPEAVAAITDHLAAHAAETSDTEAANRLRRVSPEAPFSITRSPFWVRKHRNLSDEVFRTRTVGSRANCGACHQDAATGRFADAVIAIPKE